MNTVTTSSLLKVRERVLFASTAEIKSQKPMAMGVKLNYGICQSWGIMCTSVYDQSGSNALIVEARRQPKSWIGMSSKVHIRKHMISI